MKTTIIGTQVKRLRGKFRMSQQDLAYKLDVSKQTISNWETGLKTPRMGKIQELSDIFNVSINQILTGDEDDFSMEKQINYFLEMMNYEEKKDVLHYVMKINKERNNEK